MSKTEKTRSPRKIANEQRNLERSTVNRARVSELGLVSEKRASKALRIHRRELARRNIEAVA